MKKQLTLSALVCVIMQLLTLRNSVVIAETAKKMINTDSSQKYSFSGNISREVLNNYLSRSIHYCGFAAGSPEGASPSFNDDLRVITKVGAKYISRAAFAWDVPDDDKAHFELAKKRAQIIHRIDPEIVLEADIFETVYSAKAPEAKKRNFSTNGVENIQVPDFAFKEFGLEPQNRTFRYEQMVYEDGLWRNRWCPGASVPDITRTETKLWVFYRAKNYIDAGYESIQLGQIQLFVARDPDFEHLADIIERIRKYGRKYSRRNYVLISGHISLDSHHNIVRDGKMMVDFLPFPLRLKSIPDSPLHSCLEMGYIDSVYDKVLSGTHPSGWYCANIPMLLEFDNYFNSLTNPGKIFPWGTDEITWFANQPEKYRNEFLKYAWDWIWKHTDNCFLSMPGRRVCRVPVYENANPYTTMYYCNNKSKACPKGFSQEDVIKQIWANPNYHDNANRLKLALENGQTSQGIKLPNLSEDIPVEKLKILYMAYGGFTTEVEKQHAKKLLQNPDKIKGANEQHNSYKREAELLRK